MTATQTYLAGLPAETQERLKPVFGDAARLYATIYLVVRNEHITDTEKPDRYEDRLRVIRTVKSKLEKLLDSWGLNGEEIVADVASDYFEDYVAYREQDFGMTNDDFVGIVRKIMEPV